MRCIPLYLPVGIVQLSPTLFPFLPYYQYMDAELPDFPTLQKTYYRRLYVYASVLGVRSEADREDLAHDALVRAFLSLGAYDCTRQLTPWVYAIARNSIIDFLRARKDFTLPDGDIGDQASGEDPTAEVETRDRVSRARREIERMPARDREIAMLVFFESLSAAETGRLLGMPSATVRWRLAEIRRRLRRACGEI